MRKDLAKKSGFDEEFINECCLSRPVEAVIEEIKKENNVVSKSGGYTIIANDFKSVFNAVRSLSTIRVPHKDFSSVPMGIAIDVKEHKNDRDENLHKKEGNPAPTSLNEDLIMLYKKYEITHNSQNAMDTFVVYTKRVS